MKTMKIIFKFILAALAVVTFFSCDIPVVLGSMLDISGPVVTITYPPNRKAVGDEFNLEGTVTDATGVERMEIKAVRNNIDFPRQWRYVSGVWEISDDYGTTWSPFAGAEWNGSEKSASWKILVDMVIIGSLPGEGQYTFYVQAWDKANFSDDNSYKSVILIIDPNPPKVDISYPFLYRERDYDASPLEVSPFKDYVAILESDPKEKARENPSYLGKFVTQEFDLKWQVDDPSDIYSVELRFYKVNSDGDADDDYFYRFTKNDLVPPPPDVNVSDFIKPNGSVKVSLTSAPGITKNQKGDEIYELKNPITEKTTILVEMESYDASGNINQEKKLGYFIYWPAANNPWIAFADGMKPVEGPPTSYGQSIAANGDLEKSVFTVFPSRHIKATAYQAHGVSKVVWAIYECRITDGKLSQVIPITDLKKMDDGIKDNTPSSLGTYSTIFPLEFDVPIYAGYYIVKARAYGTNDDVESTEYQMLFRVNDITFPQFIDGPFPEASIPLFMDIKSNKITIRGKVDDATEVKSLCMVWINPESEGFKAMSQLSYFRDPAYRGWAKALTLSAGGASALENIGEAYDNENRNRLWKLNFTADTAGYPPNGMDSQTNRHVYNYSREIDLTTELNIGTAAGQSTLKSQIFLFRLENTAGRTTIITYAPQGDTILPEIKVSDVTITATANALGPAKNEKCEPGQFTLIEKFNGNETITINGIWTEDSIEILDMNSYFRSNFAINVNSVTLFDQHPASGPVVNNNNFTLSQNTDKKSGTWRITIPVTNAAVAPAGQISTSVLKDTLVIDVKTSDIGGNVAQIGNSWLIKSDNLRLMRISSDKDDGIYRAGQEIDIFLEFSKPVKLAYSNTPREQLWLELSTGAKAQYKSGQTDQNSRQYFTYTVRGNENTTTPNRLNVTGLFVGTYNSGNNTYTGTSYTTSTAYSGNQNYPFAWSRGSGTEYEEVRLTMQANKTGAAEEGAGQTPVSGKGYYVRTVPTNTASGNTDLQYTLYAAKDIKIDTAVPKVTNTSVKALTSPGWYSSGDIYFSITFDEPVIIGSNTPRFPLTLRTGTTVQTSADANDVRVNGNTVTFKYTIQPGHYSNGNVIYLSSGTAPTGTITDLAGNPYPTDTSAGTIRALDEDYRRLTGIYVETRTPPAPIVRILPSNTTANNDNVIKNNVNNIEHLGRSNETTNRTLSNVYQKDLWLAIEGTGSAYQFEALEYSIDNGKNWIRAKNTTNIPVAFDKERTGTYEITARQIDRAGNITAPASYSPLITFNWDSDPLISRISSSTANGLYTNVSGRNKIALTIYFRKPLYISTGPQLTLNVTNAAGTQQITVTDIDTVNTPLPGFRDSLTFIYTVQNGHKLPANTNLDITEISGFTARDGNSASNGVDVGSLITLPAGTPKLDSSKKFTVETGDLELTSRAFAADKGVQTDSDFHGIRTDDGSYWTTLQINFNRNINKGVGTITITQDATNYRMPAVMTEAQYNRIKSVLDTSGVTTLDSLYTKGTNGYINGSGSDTSTKYILKYQYDPDFASGTGGISDNTEIDPAFVAKFRNAETVTININAAAVTINGSTLNIRLAGSSALQVPGAQYIVNLSSGSIVSDSLGNSIKDYTNGNYYVTLPGVAKPFIRIRKTQDTISNSYTSDAVTPRLKSVQPFLAYARMDCRTPNSTITYAASTGLTDLTGAVPRTTTGASTSNNNWAPDYIPPGSAAIPTVPNNTNNAGNNDDSMLTSRPGTPATTYNSSAKQITLGQQNGNTPHIGNVQGYQWWARARATTTAANNNSSLETEEVAYRTVISYSLRGANGAATAVGNGNAYAITGASTSRSILGNGDQIWIRGGDAIQSSSIPGFPFTWEDDWNDLSGKRAGIRLMTLVDRDNTTAGAAITCGRTSENTATLTLNNSLWRFVTWEMSAPAYVDFIRGFDTASSNDIAWQYGPSNWAYQSDGWTSAKESYKVNVGKHRWCDTGYNHAFAGATRGNMNFSAYTYGRPTKASNEGYAANTANR
jgi:hypothetical protein